MRVCLCVGAEMLFLGKPNKDEERGWIQAVSVSGAKGHPAVALRRERREEEVGKNKGALMCVAANYISSAQKESSHSSAADGRGRRGATVRVNRMQLNP